MSTQPIISRVDVVPVAGYDSIGMQYYIDGWQFDPKRPCLVW
ncbi:hypothetical protein [Paenarthrobacter sp. NPDC058040]